MYKIYTVARDSSYVDTTLTIHKEYKSELSCEKIISNYYPFLTRATHSTERATIFLQKQSDCQAWEHDPSNTAYVEADQRLCIIYVPTPLTELMFRTTFEQGQMAHTAQ